MAEARKHILLLLLLYINGAFFPVSKQASIRKKVKTPKESDIIEGDIVLDNKVASLILDSLGREILGYSEEEASSGGIKDPILHWKGGVVPFVMDESVDSRLRKLIGETISQFHQLTCVRFVNRTSEEDYIRFVYKDGCNSLIGRQGGEQVVTIGPGCEYKKFILHELMHTLGFFHEHSRFDRDLYVTVLYWNIVEAAKKNFFVYSHGNLDTMHLPYDYQSIMHYGNKAFSVNGLPTIQSKDQPRLKLGNDVGLTKLDVEKTKALYPCYPF